MTWQKAFKTKRGFFQSNNTCCATSQTSLPLPQAVLTEWVRGGDAFLSFQKLESVFYFPSLQKASKQVFLHNACSSMQEEASCLLPISPYRIWMNVKGGPLLQDSSRALTRIMSCKLYFAKCYSRPNACESQTASVML